MLVNLPEGWDRDPENPYAAWLTEHNYKPPAPISKGQYMGLNSLPIEFLIVKKYPFHPLFMEGLSAEERMAVVVRHYEEGHPEDFGVCDRPEQVLQRWPQLETDERSFVIVFDEVRRADQPPHDGWRWRKWGPYIGVKEPRYEYLADEPDIEAVLLFEIVEVRLPAGA